MDRYCSAVVDIVEHTFPPPSHVERKRVTAGECEINIIHPSDLGRAGCM